MTGNKAIAHEIVKDIQFRCKPVQPGKVIGRAIEVHGGVTLGAIAAVLRHEYVAPAYDETWLAIKAEHGYVLCGICHRILRKRVGVAVAPSVKAIYAKYLAQMEAAA